MSEPDIETATSADVDAVTELWVALAAGQRRHGSHILPDANRTAIRESISRHVVGETLLVARDDGIVGFVMCAVESGGFEQDDVRGLVENLYVVPDRRGGGIGAALLDAAEARLDESGVDVVSLEVMADNARARQFYRRQGYDPHRVELEKRLESDTPSKGDR